MTRVAMALMTMSLFSSMLIMASPIEAQTSADAVSAPPAITDPPPAVEDTAEQDDQVIPGVDKLPPIVGNTPTSTPTPISLKSTIEKVIEQNPQIISGELSIEAAIAARKVARANFLPVMKAETTFLVYSEKPGFGSLGGGGDTGFDPTLCALMDELDEQGFCTGMIDGLTSMLDFGSAFESKQWNWDVSVTVAQPLTPLYHAYHGYQLAELGIDIAQIELEKTKADLKMQTIDGYYAYLKAQAALGSIDEAIVSVEAHVNKAQAFYDAEFITKNDLLQAQVQLAEFKSTRLQVEQGLSITQEGLLLLLNAPPGENLVPADDSKEEFELIVQGGLPLTEDEALDLALENRTELKMVSTTKQQAAEAIKLAKGGYIPTVSMFGSYQHNEGSLMVQPDFVFGATLSWNFFQWGKVYYSVQEAQVRAEALDAAEESLVRVVKFEIKQALFSIELAVKQIEVQKEAVKAAEEQLRIEKERYDKNVNTSTEVLDATTRLVEAQVKLSTYRYSYLVALAALKKACGTL